MRPQDFKAARLHRGWSQEEAALRLRVSQPYLAMLENGKRRLTARLARRFMRVYGLAPTVLPPSEALRPPARADAQTLAEQVAALGYPGFAYLRPRSRKKNPAEVLLTALAQDDLEARLVEGLPWLLLRYWDLDANWLVNQTKQRDLQNRLGFVVTMARQLARRSAPENENRNRVLAELEARLERSLLAREDTLCQTSLTDAERRWLRQHRPEEAARWNLLTSWRSDAFRYASQT